MLTSIFTPATCSSCKLCCNFCPASSWETPYLENKLADQLEARGIALTTRPNGSRSFALHFHMNDPQETCNCPLLNPDSGCTLPRAERPFECRVWPLRLMYTPEGALCIACYDSCPALNTPEAKKAMHDYATGELLPVMLQYAAEHPQSIRPFNPNYSVLWIQA